MGENMKYVQLNYFAVHQKLTFNTVSQLYFNFFLKSDMASYKIN